MFSKNAIISLSNQELNKLIIIIENWIIFSFLSDILYIYDKYFTS